MKTAQVIISIYKKLQVLKMTHLDFPSCFFRELNDEIVVQWVDWTFAVAFTSLDHGAHLH